MSLSPGTGIEDHTQCSVSVGVNADSIAKGRRDAVLLFNDRLKESIQIHLFELDVFSIYFFSFFFSFVDLLQRRLRCDVCF